MHSTVHLSWLLTLLQLSWSILIPGEWPPTSPAEKNTFGSCDFDKGCDWYWKVNGTFKVVKPPLSEPLAPKTDASKRTDGNFLWLTGKTDGQLQSRVIPTPDKNCYLSLELYQVEMQRGIISLIIENYNRTSYVGKEGTGNNNSRWETTKYNLGGINQDFSIIIEVQTPYDNSSIAIDNIRLVDCFQKSRTIPHNECTERMFRCNVSGVLRCLDRDHVCDLAKDCDNGEDESADCDKMPEHAKCNFENGWCGWSNVKGKALNWTLQQGSANVASPNERVGPEVDHTYGNSSGTYAYVYSTGNYGNRGTINSPIFNPPPPYHDDSRSQYYKSCKLRLFQYRSQSGALAAYVVELQAHQNYSHQVWWSLKDDSYRWKSKVISLPPVTHKYYLQFEASKSYESKADLAIDDVSLSPECFGLGVPAEVVGDYNYYTQKIPPWDTLPRKHSEFSNETVVEIGTCGQTGRIGPTPELCTEYENATSGVEVLSTGSVGENDASLRNKGVQRWIAPSGGFYTIIASGARGGTGALSMGISLGAMVRGVVELEKGQKLYFMVGQPGTDACPKVLGSKNDTCQQSIPISLNSTHEITSAVRQIKNMRITDGGGGGGGATYIFTLRENGEQQPLLIAAGGGGLGPTQFIDDAVQHGKGQAPPDRKPYDGQSFTANAGGGGGWLHAVTNESALGAAQRAKGMSLSRGGIGGVGCGPNHRGHSDGGFGGGGGGCQSGGGGGGYVGGGTGHADSGNGEGGYSFAASDLLHVSFLERANSGPGKVFIIPAISGCGCNFRCVIVDHHLSETRCICSDGWQLDSDGKSCIKGKESEKWHRTVLIFCIIVSFALVGAFSCLCHLLYTRYQQKKALKKRRQVMFGNGTELTTLRVVSDSMMTEFNPNYEFAGNLYSFKDLPQIAREDISLVKPLGQGAFGEVYQGIYKYRRTEENPVAVKTLPSLSTSQAEADFMMEALIMSKFNHPNIVRFVGVSFDKHPRYIVLELLAGGDLKKFLREERPRPDRPTTLTMHNLIMCAYDVAKGCKYMEDARFIHRDIAARNCLLNSKGPDRVVKIADFGMARDIYRSDYYKKGGKAMLPIKWMPPESFLDGIFTTKTDVWAFGVLLWEIMSFGYMPYTGCANREVMSMVTSGGRLERPAGCPDPIYGIMTRCWHPFPEDRPSFRSIVERLGYCLQDPDVVNLPTPNYDLLPICDREITIMRPDPETECINVDNPDLDACAYMQPRVAFRPSSYRIGQAPGVVYASLSHATEERKSDNRNKMHDSPPREHYHRHSNAVEEHDLDDICDNRDRNKQPQSIDEDDEPNANITPSTCQTPASVSNDGDGDDDVDDDDYIDDNNDPNNVVESKSTLARGQNGNGESTTTTDTNSDSMFIPSSGTPPDTASSSPNTRNSSPNHAASAANEANNGNGSPNNVNGIIRKSALKAALSLDPSALYRGTIPYEKIAFSQQKQRLNNPGNTEIRKDSLSHELPREEECSC